ncbi:RT0821/Lpp0805 family surface protein [Lichenihabitans sp. Uapishka_5]|uniref:RT0821/Lpp0805 family surface protein n=1 Tax=Lichenihabitans sp. Uapishka_5 TaxID=3037302 RepID=UPI0029E7D2B9|nr:RT0821/Lpp0805 family surface protein [Lichenihabitans sp. Uapishka_5]MDX7951894.1 RT0821/Lpp0805 family surface protein [Lichenihabitans sp. Uapishka_5]
MFQGATGRRAPGWRPVAILATFCAFGLGGCSLAVPMSGTVADETPTGTIKLPQGHASPFSSQMDVEDARRAKSALDTALDPQGNGAAVAWENPRSGAKGSFVPLAQVYPKGDGICRPFSAHVSIKGEAETVAQSTACRVNSGDWVVGRLTAPPDRAAGKDAGARKSDNLAERDTGTQLR